MITVPSDLDSLPTLTHKQAYYILRYKTEGFENCQKQIHEWVKDGKITPRIMTNLCVDMWKQYIY